MMTEETPFNPRSKKGEVRAKIATSLINEWKAGALTAMIARAADFHGPETPNGLQTPWCSGRSPRIRKRRGLQMIRAALLYLHAGCGAKPCYAGRK